MRVFGIDPGSHRTGYGCVESDGRRHRVVVAGVVSAPRRAAWPETLLAIHERLAALLAEHRPDVVAVETLFYASNVRTALKLGHARGVAVLAAIERGIPLAEYTPAEIKRAVVGYGRAEKAQVQEMVRLLLGLRAVPSPHDVADALAVAICHVHHQQLAPHSPIEAVRRATRGLPRSWRQYRPGRPARRRGEAGAEKD